MMKEIFQPNKHENWIHTEWLEGERQVGDNQDITRQGSRNAEAGGRTVGLTGLEQRFLACLICQLKLLDWLQKGPFRSNTPGSRR